MTAINTESFVATPSVSPSLRLSVPPSPSPIPLAPLIAATKAGAVLDLPKATYVLTEPAILLQPGLTIKGNGSTLICPAQHAAFIAAAAHVTIDGFVVDACNMFCSPQADRVTVSNCYLGLARHGAVGQAVKTGQGGTNFTLLNCHVGVTVTVSVYVDRDNPSILGCTLDGSINEYVVRGETPDGIAIPTGLVIAGSTIGALQSQVNAVKDSIGLREFKGCRITNSTIYRNIRLGQQGGPPSIKPGQYCDVLIDLCKFFGAHPGLSYLSVYQGVTATVTHNRFDQPADPSIVCAPQSVCTTGGNCNAIAHGGRAYPVYWDAGGQHVDQGGDSVIVLPA